MRIAIIYVSEHHLNTKKLVQEMSKKMNFDLFSLEEFKSRDIEEYDVIGLASGIFYNNLHNDLVKFIKDTEWNGKKVFLMVTCGFAYKDYTKSAKNILIRKRAEVLGSFQCRGYDTFGPFGKIGGIAKGHPNEEDVESAVRFVENLL